MSRNWEKNCNSFEFYVNNLKPKDYATYKESQRMKQKNANFYILSQVEVKI